MTNVEIKKLEAKRLEELRLDRLKMNIIKLVTDEGNYEYLKQYSSWDQKEVNNTLMEFTEKFLLSIDKKHKVISY